MGAREGGGGDRHVWQDEVIAIIRGANPCLTRLKLQVFRFCNACVQRTVYASTCKPTGLHSLYFGAHGASRHLRTSGPREAGYIGIHRT